MPCNRRKGIHVFVSMKIQPTYGHFCNNSSYNFGFVVPKIRNFHPQRSVFVNLATEFLIWHPRGTPPCSRQWQAVPVPIFHFIWLAVKTELCLYLL